MTTPSQEEARQALADIAEVTGQMRQALRGSVVSSVLMLWGLLWMALFTWSYLRFPKGDGTIPWILNGCGYVVTAFLVLRGDRQIRGAASRRVMFQISGLWAAVIAYAFALTFLIPAVSWTSRLALLLSVIMLGFVIMGIWLEDAVLVVLGLAITLVILAGRAWLAPAPFLLWLGLLGGGGLLAGGLIVRFRWK
jgi:hypothetical protein